jgi:hypothetical protein
VTALIANSSRTDFWTPPCRFVVFTLAASSIWCLLAEFYGLCSMRTFTLFISLPALFILAALTITDLALGNQRLWRTMVVGCVAGLLAAVAYDVFRLPFVFARSLHIESVVPPLNLFKVFPRFGAMILGQPIEQTGYSLATQFVGWTYHFSNGVTFGVMYVAMIGDATRRHWAWAVCMAVGLELAMLFTPYPRVFGIQTTGMFVAITLAAHLVFGAALGLIALCLSRLCKSAAT